MKRKVARIVNKRMFGSFLLRDPEATDFPYVEKGQDLRWLVRNNRGMDFRGVGFEFKEYIAYVDGNGQWDVANKYNLAIPEHDNPWLDCEKRYLSEAEQVELRTFAADIPQERQGRLTVTAFIPFDEIIAVDEMGDQCWGYCERMPVLFVPITMAPCAFTLIPRFACAGVWTKARPNQVLS
ncbi:hypothetical protein IVB30_31310 [Bradyrhizobium sp. 200]|uniref:hypothetical protein n=1 Tax=Bradyrhizobium sp. 200 TaxID=2782665 RepID=UPI001FFFBB8E|nr:hypothetical protein [Bradyrhizobium sp. 200]UPJ47708.1 hypothetical protein IVB30_31310 [Bradyrhizobium sp. 200]